MTMTHSRAARARLLAPSSSPARSTGTGRARSATLSLCPFCSNAPSSGRTHPPLSPLPHPPYVSSDTLTSTNVVCSQSCTEFKFLSFFVSKLTFPLSSLPPACHPRLLRCLFHLLRSPHEFLLRLPIASSPFLHRPMHLLLQLGLFRRTIGLLLFRMRLILQLWLRMF